MKGLAVFFLLAVALCGSGTAIADAPYVTVQNANVREQADVNSTRVITLPKGTRVDVTFKEGIGARFRATANTSVTSG